LTQGAAKVAKDNSFCLDGNQGNLRGRMAQEGKDAGMPTTRAPDLPQLTRPPAHEEPSMEIHKPHAAKTWKEFFIELGTIVLGILIAIALEQTVDYFHHLSQLHTVRKELVAELEENQHITAFNRAKFAKMRSALTEDIAILREGDAAGGQSKFDYSWQLARTQDGAWQAAKQGGVLELMPRDELRRYAFVYHTMDDFMAAVTPAVTRLQVAQAITQRTVDGAFSQRGRDDLLAATSEAQGQLAFAEQIMEFEDTGLKTALSSH
jgi:hypothetical protein